MRRPSCAPFSSASPKTSGSAPPQACIDAVEAALDFIKPGVTSHDADTAARAVTTKAGFSEYHRNRLGYSIGVNYAPDWGEGEIISLQQNEPRVLNAGMTFHMPPLCLKYREFGIGFSETIVVNKQWLRAALEAAARHHRQELRRTTLCFWHIDGERGGF